MTRIAQESSAQALQYGPTEGFAETRECIREVMQAEGMDPDLDDIIVTTGGQQAKANLLFDNAADAPNPLDDLIRLRGGEIEPHLRAATAVDVGRGPGHEGDVLA